MRALYVLFSICFLAGCNNNQSKEEKKASDIMENESIKNDLIQNYISLWESLPEINVIRGLEKDMFNLPKLERKSDKIFMINEAYEENIDEITIDTINKSMTGGYGDYSLSMLIKTNKSKNDSILILHINELGGNFMEQSLVILKRDRAGKWDDITENALPIPDLIKDFKYPLNSTYPLNYFFEYNLTQKFDTLSIRISKAKSHDFLCKENQNLNNNCDLSDSLFIQSISLKWQHDKNKYRTLK